MAARKWKIPLGALVEKLPILAKSRGEVDPEARIAKNQRKLEKRPDS